MSKHSKKRVCHISTVHPLTDVRVFHRECCSLAKAGYDVHLVIPAEEPATRHGVHIHPLPKVRRRFLRMLFAPWLAMVIALRTKAAIYHYHDPELLPSAFVLRWLFRKKVVFDIHESVARQIMSKPYLPKCARTTVSHCYRLLERVLTVGQSLIIANTNSARDYPSNAFLVQNYPLLDQGLIAMARPMHMRSRIPLLVYVGGVARIRGGLVYVELAGKLAERGRDFRMQIVGPYGDKFGQELLSRISELRLQDKVVLTGRLDWPEAMKIVSRATIGMCLLLPVPNYVTCLATKIVEYMMLGTPVLASDFDCWRDLVEGEKVGAMADPAEIEQVADVCEQMLDNPGDLQAMGQRGMAAVRRRYNWEGEFQELIRCYDDLLK